MVSNKLYGNANVQSILLKKRKDGTTVERPLGTLSLQALQAYREGKPPTGSRTMARIPIAERIGTLPGRVFPESSDGGIR